MDFMLAKKHELPNSSNSTELDLFLIKYLTTGNIETEINIIFNTFKIT